MAPPKRPLYETEKDPTLTKKQAKEQAFYKGADDYRTGSNPTLQGYSTGYHEAALTTDTWKFLRRAKPKSHHQSSHPTATDKHILPGTAPQNSYFLDWTGKWVYSRTLEWVLRNGDGFRTDTSQTIMSAEEGFPAGHAGSDVSRKRESQAHDLLRAKIMELLRIDPKTKGLTEAAVVVIMGAMTVASMAPGEIARGLVGGTSSLKAGADAQDDWEENRTEAKLRVNETYDLLPTQDEKDFVTAHAVSFLDSTQEKVPTLQRRRIASRATSPLRSTAGVAGEVAGGGYMITQPTLKATKASPMSSPGMPLREVGMYMTESLRAGRRAV